jgi:hypothetical protein
MGKTPHKRGLSTETHDRGGSFCWVLPAGLWGACPARFVSEIMHEIASSFKLKGAIVAIVFRDSVHKDRKRGLPHGNQATTEFGGHR